MLAAAVAALAGAAIPLPADAAVTGSSRFIPVMLVYYGGGPALTAADAPRLAKYDLIDIDRFRYNQIGGSTWAAIKAHNPKVEIYLYEMGAESPSHLDVTGRENLNGLGRYDVARGHPMGSLNRDHPELYLRDSSGKRIYNTAFSNVGANQYWYLMDFGAASYQSYWVTAVKADIVDQPWVADGVFVDNCLTFPAGASYNATAVKYATDSAWSTAMNAFVSAIAAGVHGYGQKLWCNRGGSGAPNAAALWKALDASADPPDVVLEEGAFAVEWGAPVQFYPEATWKNQVDMLGAITNSKIGLMSHTQLAPGQSGTDNWGKPVTFWQTFYYALGSLLLGKNAQLNNAYLMFSSGTGYDRIIWYDEYDKLDLGKPLGAYSVTTSGGVNVYWREFEKGYVAVNPTVNNVASLALPQPAQRITHDNLLAPLASIPVVRAIGLPGHHAAILMKTAASVASRSAPIY
ncbi:MAG TPA: putative glycoside hydrolase [Roseiflexaceae bacterium]|jgi:hypothetical protein